MRVVVTVPLPDRKTGEPRILKTHLFNFFDLSADESSERASCSIRPAGEATAGSRRIEPMGPDQGRGRMRDDQQVRDRAL